MFFKQMGEDEGVAVYSADVLLGYLNTGGRTGFFTDRKSFSGSELDAIATKLRCLLEEREDD